MSGNLLEIENLSVHFHTPEGIVRAVDEITFQVAPFLYMREQVIANGKNADLDTVGQQSTKNSNNNSEAVLDCHSRDDSGYSIQEFIVNKHCERDD